MSIKDAAEQTFELIPDQGLGVGYSSAEHLRSLMRQVATGKVEGGKAHRYLGYVQGVLVAYSIISVDYFRTVNRNCDVYGD